MFRRLTRLRKHPMVLTPLLGFLFMILAYSLAFILHALTHKTAFMEIVDIVDTESATTIFAVFMNLASSQVFYVVLFRYQYAKHQLASTWYRLKYLRIFNIVTSVIGYFIMIGMILFANFPLHVKRTVTLIGAALNFILPSPYMILSTFLFCILNRGDRKGRKLNILRTFIAIIHTVFAIMHLVSYQTFISDKDDKNATHSDDEPDYTLGMIAQYTEAYSFSFYILTHVYEFAYMSNYIVSEVWSPVLKFASTNIKDYY